MSASVSVVPLSCVKIVIPRDELVDAVPSARVVSEHRFGSGAACVTVRLFPDATSAGVIDALVRGRKSFSKVLVGFETSMIGRLRNMESPMAKRVDPALLDRSLGPAIEIAVRNLPPGFTANVIYEGAGRQTVWEKPSLETTWRVWPPAAYNVDGDGFSILVLIEANATTAPTLSFAQRVQMRWTGVKRYDGDLVTLTTEDGSASVRVHGLALASGSDECLKLVQPLGFGDAPKGMTIVGVTTKEALECVAGQLYGIPPSEEDVAKHAFQLLRAGSYLGLVELELRSVAVLAALGGDAATIEAAVEAYQNLASVNIGGDAGEATKAKLISDMYRRNLRTVLAHARWPEWRDAGLGEALVLEMVRQHAPRGALGGGGVAAEGVATLVDAWDMFRREGMQDHDARILADMRKAGAAIVRHPKFSIWQTKMMIVEALLDNGEQPPSKRAKTA